jgi:cytochrome c biogenesis protein CcmG, thiol:disulfide interchange protein DsbE
MRHASLERTLLVSLLVLACGALAGQGDTAADFALTDVRGATVRLSDLRGSVVYVDFWASWCAPCLKSFPWMNQIEQRYAARGLKIVAVNLDQKRADADGFLAKFPRNSPSSSTRPAPPPGPTKSRACPVRC